MILYQITEARLRELDKLWHDALNTYRGPAPRSLGLCHMLAETNGTVQPVTRDAAQRTIGLMRIAMQDVQRLGYSETPALDPRVNVRLWCCLANEYAQSLHAYFPRWWLTANLDFWLAVRLAFIMGVGNTKNLLSLVDNANAGRTTAAVIVWIRSVAPPTTRFGKITYFDLCRIADHLEQVLDGMIALDGATYRGSHFGSRVVTIHNEDVLYSTTNSLARREGLC